MIDKVNNNKVSDILRDSPARQSNDSRSSADNNADAMLHVSHGSLAEKAQQEPVEDVKAVERARQLLLSGQLLTPENIHKAAENILKSGI
ncbi:MAG: hypothetical protein H8E17_07415 [Deltaproteobacteria bacterium]|nr:hypothetical protein [Deltaproteobacteria bacterium]